MSEKAPPGGRSRHKSANFFVFSFWEQLVLPEGTMNYSNSSPQPANSVVTALGALKIPARNTKNPMCSSRILTLCVVFC